MKAEGDKEACINDARYLICAKRVRARVLSWNGKDVARALLLLLQQHRPHFARIHACLGARLHALMVAKRAEDFHTKNSAGSLRLSDI